MSLGTFMFALWQSSDSVTFQTDVPTADKLKRKVILIVKARQDKNVEITDANISREVMMMEINRSILENLYLICQVSHSNLDLMLKFAYRRCTCLC
jgi:hypothetical protein